MYLYTLWPYIYTAVFLLDSLLQLGWYGFVRLSWQTFSAKDEDEDNGDVISADAEFDATKVVQTSTRVRSSLVLFHPAQICLRFQEHLLEPEVHVLWTKRCASLAIRLWIFGVASKKLLQDGFPSLSQSSDPTEERLCGDSPLLPQQLPVQWKIGNKNVRWPN
jgi:hypothetical protein